MKSEKEILERQLDKIEKQLDGNRATVLEDGWQTSNFARKSRKWDVLAQQKIKILSRLFEIEIENRPAH